MTSTVTDLDQLQEFRDELPVITSSDDWPKIRAWARGFRSFLVRRYPDDVADFDDVVKEPDWLCLPRVGAPRPTYHSPFLADRMRGRDLQRERNAQQFNDGARSAETSSNDKLARDAYAEILGFIDGLIRLERNAVQARPQSPKVSGSNNVIINGMNVKGDATVASSISNSFNRVKQSGAPNELRTRLEALHELVAQLPEHLNDEDAQEAAEYLEEVTGQALSERPKVPMLLTAASQLATIAEKAAELGPRVRAAVEAISGWFQNLG